MIRTGNRDVTWDGPVKELADDLAATSASNSWTSSALDIGRNWDDDAASGPRSIRRLSSDARRGRGAPSRAVDAGQVSLWFIPAVALLLGLAYVVGAPLVREAVVAHLYKRPTCTSTSGS